MIATSEDGRRVRPPSQAKLDARRLYQAMNARLLEEARALEEANTPSNTVVEPTPEPTPGPLTREQLARRLELIRNRHRALIASGRIQGRHR